MKRSLLVFPLLLFVLLTAAGCRKDTPPAADDLGGGWVKAGPAVTEEARAALQKAAEGTAHIVTPVALLAKRDKDGTDWMLYCRVSSSVSGAVSRDAVYRVHADADGTCSVTGMAQTNPGAGSEMASMPDSPVLSEEALSRWKAAARAEELYGEPAAYLGSRKTDFSGTRHYYLCYDRELSEPRAVLADIKEDGEFLSLMSVTLFTFGESIRQIVIETEDAAPSD